jgi:hypothetical protein
MAAFAYPLPQIETPCRHQACCSALSRQAMDVADANGLAAA